MFFLIVFTFTFVGAMIGSINDAFNEARKREMLGMDGTDFDDHVVICGWTNIGKVALDELMATKQKTVVITGDEDEIKKIRDAGDEKYIYPVFGDYKNDELKNTLYSTGVTYISFPSEMAGRMVASAAFEPKVARFVEDITTSTSGYDVQ
ncbi:MAG: NAD-binding protein [Candidatus Thermoplasmatota archaeon]|nr:NAD-binding protein [Candidatus Thermoplasmatota archaeon]